MEEMKLYAGNLIDTDPYKTAYDRVLEELQHPDLDEEARRLLLEEKAQLEQEDFMHQGHALSLVSPADMERYRQVTNKIRAYQDDPDRLRYEWTRVRRQDYEKAREW